jgi:deoxyribodipyrimidine photo-lyase
MNPPDAKSHIDPSRVQIIRPRVPASGPVFYWLSRDQRVRDNWALLYAQEQALRIKSPLAVVFCLVPDFLGAPLRQYEFMLRGMEEVERDLARKNIPFFLLAGEPAQVLPAFLRKQGARLVVTDFDPLKIKRLWKNTVSRSLDIPFHEVDTHNIVPCRIASPKPEYGAYTLRPKLQKLLPHYLTEFPALKRHPHRLPGRTVMTDWRDVRRSLELDTSVAEVAWIKPGEGAAARALRRFVNGKLDRYAADRNDPNLDGQSHLSTYLHFGQLSAQRVALEVMKANVNEESREAFLEELIVRRELSDNFCFYGKDYDSPRCFPAWAQKTLSLHLKDKREYEYTRREFEEGRTHDNLWNAAQLAMVTQGTMPGYLRMYWAKKILEWTRSPGVAMKIAIHLNDKYQLDGRDPNGYAGIAWSIGGVHDRPWGERKIFGMVRYMNYSGCTSKFDVKGYIGKVGKMTRSRSTKR